MLTFDLGQVAQQLADGSVSDSLESAFVKTPRLHLHNLDLFSHGIDSEWTHQPNGAAVDESFHILAPDERYVFAKALAVGVNQAIAVSQFLGAHPFEHLGRGGIRVAQPLGE